MSEYPGSSPRQRQRPRPKLTLTPPPRANLESLFPGGAGAGMSPGPMTPLVSSFLSSEQQQSPVLVIPPGLSPSDLLDSPAFFSSGRFGMSHQEDLAQVTAFLTQPPVQEMLPVTYDSDNTAFESAEVSHSENKSQSTTVVDKPADDGYNWRKYGEKQVKGSEFVRSYYKCTHPSCPVKKKVEHSLQGWVTEIVYSGEKHNHPPPNKRAKEGGVLPAGSNDINENLDFHAHLARSNDVHVSASKRGRESSYGTPKHIYGSSDGEELVEAQVRTDEADANENDMKRTRTESRITLQITSEVDLQDDGYRWRKYGQKVVKGNPNPRSYYRCTYAGCNVRKHVERSSTDPKAVRTTYEGKHNHGVPPARNSSHNTANAAASANIMHPNAQSQAFFNRRDFL
ncbi:hypothetical protein J5N97_008473 [Dioscorea zingiberensis]|uniref:WRKY domain-containing protein n=1 Tax=Dioscorea zingiberensis TaxID=325984 RepID=A0A9D5CVU0_9LILI|nr:hypothetical protein J5N97_008473 [Dioscorea zingiberensis]